MKNLLLALISFALLLMACFAPMQALAQSDSSSSIRGTAKVRARSFNPFRANRLSRFSVSRFGFPRFVSKFDRSAEEEEVVEEEATAEPVDAVSVDIAEVAPVAISTAIEVADVSVVSASATVVGKAATEPETPSMNAGTIVGAGTVSSATLVASSEVTVPLAAASSGRPPYRPPVRSPYRPPPRPAF